MSEWDIDGPVHAGKPLPSNPGTSKSTTWWGVSTNSIVCRPGSFSLHWCSCARWDLALRCSLCSFSWTWTTSYSASRTFNAALMVRLLLQFRRQAVSLAFWLRFRLGIMPSLASVITAMGSSRFPLGISLGLRLLFIELKLKKYDLRLRTAKVNMCFLVRFVRLPVCPSLIDLRQNTKWSFFSNLDCTWLYCSA